MPTNELDGAAIRSFLDSDGIPEMPTMPTIVIAQLRFVQQIQAK